uniref:Uncharacterized protein n=1 Tax=Caenorhabditis japonica TaxID=281687 RepID=A0A8R1E9D0_CAEJA
MRRKRQSETPEERAIRKKKDRESRRLRRADSTEKEKMMERISNSQLKLETRLSETQERAEERRASLQSNSKAKRASETKEQRTERFAYHSTRYRKKKDEKNATTAKDAFGAGPLHPSTEKALSYGQLYTMDTKQAAEERRSVAPNKNLADQERAGKDLEGIKDFRKLTYIEMPECFTFDKTRGEYAPRLLLLYTKSATSFSDMKTNKDDNGIPTVHDTFVEAAKAQGLLSDDAVVIKSLEEMAAYHMPAQLRAAFFAILA